jgi:TrpR-related protein YerC/YecD
MSKGMNKNTSIGVVKIIEGIGPKIDWNTKINRQFIEAVLALKNADETKRFLRDLMTEGEILEFANRLEAARLLSTDEQYKGIIERTGLSSTTIARISKWLN